VTNVATGPDERPERGRNRQDVLVSDYVLTVVLYAVVLFFAGMSTRIAGRRQRWILDGIGCLVLVTAIAWIATFPVSVEI
jgi:hypothetical protein